MQLKYHLCYTFSAGRCIKKVCAMLNGISRSCISVVQLFVCCIEQRIASAAKLWMWLWATQIRDHLSSKISAAFSLGLNLFEWGRNQCWNGWVLWQKYFGAQQQSLNEVSFCAKVEMQLFQHFTHLQSKFSSCWKLSDLLQKVPVVGYSAKTYCKNVSGRFKQYWWTCPMGVKRSDGVKSSVSTLYRHYSCIIVNKAFFWKLMCHVSMKSVKLVWTLSVQSGLVTSGLSIWISL